MAKTGGGRHADQRGAAQPPAPQTDRIRLDKWLWQARFFKSRSLATELVLSGHVRVNGQPTAKPAREVGAGDVLTFPQGRNIRLIRIVGTGVRRGPATEAQTLFIDLDAPDATPDCLE